MNENFVNIKLDREERPDVDSRYMVPSEPWDYYLMGYVGSYLCKRQLVGEDGL